MYTFEIKSKVAEDVSNYFSEESAPLNETPHC